MTVFGGRLPLMVSFRRAGTTSRSKSVDPATSPATSFLSSSKSDGASCVSFSRFDGTYRVSSSGSDDVSCVFSLRSDGTSSVSYPGSNGASRVSASGSGSASCASCLGSDSTSPVAPSKSAPVTPYRGPAAAPAPALAPRTSTCGAPLFPTDSSSLGFTSRFHRQHHCCRSCQARQSTAPSGVSLSPTSAPSRAPSDPSSRFHCLNRFLRYLLTRVREHAVYLHRIMHFRHHRQRRLLPRIPSPICAGSPLACPLYSHRLSRFCCQPQCYLLTRVPSHTYYGTQSLAGEEVKNKRLLPREPQNSLRFVVVERFTPLLYCFTGGQQVPRKSWHIPDGNPLHWLNRSNRLVQVHLNCLEPVYRQNGPISDLNSRYLRPS